MKRVVYYARVSTEEEQQASALLTQCSENEEYISSKKSWCCVDKYIDEGKSGTTTYGRTEFLRMVKDMEQDKFDIILIKQIDRGWRNLADWKRFEKILIQCNIKLFIRLKNDYYDIEDDGSYISTTMDSMFAEWYSRNLSKKLNSAHKTRMKKGTIVTNGKLWGYKQIDADLIVKEDEAKVVQYVYNTYILGKGFRTIGQELNDMGIRNRNGGMFSLTTLKRMIRNEKYKGTLICGKQHKNFYTKKIEPVPKEQWIIHEDRIPAIVSKEIWEEANQILDAKRKRYSTNGKGGYFQGTYPLSSKIKCSLCGKKYYHDIFSVASGKYGVWECATYKSYGKNERGCSNTILREAELTKIVKDIIYDLWIDKEKNIEDIISVLEKVTTTIDNSKELSKLELDRNKLKQKKEKNFDLFAEEIISKDDFQIRDKEISAKLDICANKYHNLKSNEESQNRGARIRKIKRFFDQNLKDVSSITDRMIKEMVSEIVVYPDRKLDITIAGPFYPCVSTVRSY